MTQPTTRSTRIACQVSPYRFTDRPSEVIEFLRAVGLRVEASKDGWADLVGTGGRVGVHHSPRRVSRTHRPRCVCSLATPSRWPSSCGGPGSRRGGGTRRSDARPRCADRSAS